MKNCYKTKSRSYEKDRLFVLAEKKVGEQEKIY